MAVRTRCERGGANPGGLSHRVRRGVPLSQEAVRTGCQRGVANSGGPFAPGAKGDLPFPEAVRTGCQRCPRIRHGLRTRYEGEEESKEDHRTGCEGEFGHLRNCSHRVRIGGRLVTPSGQRPNDEALEAQCDDGVGAEVQGVAVAALEHCAVGDELFFRPLMPSVLSESRLNSKRRSQSADVRASGRRSKQRSAYRWSNSGSEKEVAPRESRRRRRPAQPLSGPGSRACPRRRPGSNRAFDAGTCPSVLPHAVFTTPSSTAGRCKAFRS